MNFQKTTTDGVDTWENLCTFDWHSINILRREGGSVCLYGTATAPVHAIIWDSLDKHSPDEYAELVIAKLTEMRNGINTLIDAVNYQKFHTEAK